MTRVGTIDQVLLLLREQLQRSGKARDPSRANGAGRSGRAHARPLERVRALATLDSLGEEDVRRALVRGLLTEELGEGIANDAAFQRIADDVLRIIGEMPGGPALIDRAIAQLKEGRK